MVWRKSFFYSVIISCLVLGSIPTPLRAADLIDILKSKDILNQQEADQLKQEQKENAKQAVTLPPALQGFKFGTTIYGEWNNKKPDNGASGNNFNVNRAYLTLTKEVNDWLGMNLTADVNYNAGQGWQLRQKYAFVALKFFDTITELGLGHTPSDDYDGSIWPYRVQGKHLLDDLGIQASADFGVNNKGSFGKWGGYMVGVYNGSGYTISEANNNKVVSGLIYLRPLPDVTFLKGLQLAYTGSYGKSNNNFVPATQPGTVATDYPDFQANIAQLSLQYDLFTIMGQYYWGKATATSVEDFSRKAYLAEAFVRIPGAERLRVFGRYQYYDPNTDKDNDTSKKVVAGLSYDWAKEFMPFIAYEKKTFDTTAAGADYDQYQVGFQLKF